MAFYGNGAQGVSDRLLELAQIEAGHRVLDIATGIGEPAATAARRVGATGHVTATYQSPNMLEIAQERAVDLGLQNIEFEEIDAEAMDFPEKSFDAVLCCWGLMFLPDLESTVRQINQSLVPGGRFATAVWDAPEKMPVFSLPMGVVGRMLELPPPSAGAPVVFSLADRDSLAQTFSAAGFTEVQGDGM